MKKWVKCFECGKSFRYIIWKHLKQHNLTMEFYRKKYPNANLVSEVSLGKMKSFQQNYNPMKGKKNPKRVILNKLQSGRNHPNYNKHLSEETRKKISETKKKLFREEKLKHPWIGRKHTKKSIEKNKISHLRENLSKETLEKMSRSHKGVIPLTKGLRMEQFYGEKRAQLIKQKQSEAKQDKYSGKKNPGWKGGIKLGSGGYLFL